MKHREEIESLKKQIIEKYHPIALYLFGSCAKGCIRKNSDIDLCAIMETNDKRLLLSEMYTNIDSEIPFDLILYTPDSWNKNADIPGTFAHLIKEKGVMLYG